MKQSTKTELWDIAKIGIFSAIVGAPLGVWANRKWPDDKWKTAALLLGFSFVVRYVGLHMIEKDAGELQ